MAKVIELAEQVCRNLFEDTGKGMGDIAFNLYIKPVSLTAFVAGASFVGSTIWAYEANRRGNNTSYFTLRGWELKQKEHVGPDTMVTSGNNVYFAILYLNTVVWLAWKIPTFRSFMKKWFQYSVTMPWKVNFIMRFLYFGSLDKGSHAPWIPMFLCTFSHIGLDHIGWNMFFLYMVMPSSVDIRKPSESRRLRVTRVEFIGFYLTAAAVTQLGALLLHTLMPYPALRGVGASGAIFAVLGYTGTRMPDSKCFKVIPAHWALKYFMFQEITTLIVNGWKPSGTSAHVTGLLFGLVYGYYESSLDLLRDRILKIYHRYRGSRSSGNGDS